MQPGEFDEVVAIERPNATRDSTGGSSIAWLPVANDVFAKVIQPSNRAASNETALAGRVSETREIVFKFRAPFDLRSGDCIVWNDERYAVEGVVTDRRDGVLTANGVFRAGTDGR